MSTHDHTPARSPMNETEKRWLQDITAMITEVAMRPDRSDIELVSFRAFLARINLQLRERFGARLPDPAELACFNSFFPRESEWALTYWEGFWRGPKGGNGEVAGGSERTV